MKIVGTFGEGRRGGKKGLVGTFLMPKDGSCVVYRGTNVEVTNVSDTGDYVITEKSSNYAGNWISYLMTRENPQCKYLTSKNLDIDKQSLENAKILEAYSNLYGVDWATLIGIHPNATEPHQKSRMQKWRGERTASFLLGQPEFSGFYARCNSTDHPDLTFTQRTAQ